MDSSVRIRWLTNACNFSSKENPLLASPSTSHEYTHTLSLGEKGPGMVVHASYPSTWGGGLKKDLKPRLQSQDYLKTGNSRRHYLSIATSITESGKLSTDANDEKGVFTVCYQRGKSNFPSGKPARRQLNQDAKISLSSKETPRASCGIPAKYPDLNLSMRT